MLKLRRSAFSEDSPGRAALGAPSRPRVGKAERSVPLGSSMGRRGRGEGVGTQARLPGQRTLRSPGPAGRVALETLGSLLIGWPRPVPAHCRSASLHWPARRPARVPRAHWRWRPDPLLESRCGEQDWWSSRPRVAAVRPARRCVPTMAAPMQPTASWAPAGVPRGCSRRLHRHLRLQAPRGAGRRLPLPLSVLR